MVDKVNIETPQLIHELGFLFMNHNKTTRFDLDERTACFGEAVIDFVRTLSKNAVMTILVDQFIRAATSVGANYAEADGAESKKDFRHKIALCKKEAKEARHWMRMIARADPDHTKTCRELWSEAHELTLIFSAILRNSSRSS